MSSANFSQFQSAYRQGHCTETDLIDVYTAADVKQVTVLIGLDLSAAFDTVCHQTLLQRLETEFGVSGTALSYCNRSAEMQSKPTGSSCKFRLSLKSTIIRLSLSIVL